jgi:hypothetical protein
VIGLERIGTLDVAAASGLVVVGDELVVIADDELVLSRYGGAGEPRGRVALFGGTLPDEPAARKRAKPDLEALALLPDGRLLALGSGSAAGRDRGALVDGADVRLIDLAPLYRELRSRFEPLNVEGAAVLGGELLLLSRRTGRQGRNAIARLDLAAAIDALERGWLEASLLLAVDDVELGAVEGTPLGFTDAAPWRGGLLYAAAAEVTDDPVADGACVGCELGWMDATGAVRARGWVDPCVKLEGVAVRGERLVAVADSDDRALPAPLFAADVPAGFG